MSDGLILFPEQASTSAEKVDALLAFLLGVSTVVTAIIATAILYFCFKYRRRPGAPRPPRILGSLRLELFWTALPLVFGLAMFVWGAKIYIFVSTPPPNALEVYVVGRQWMWKIQHATGQREINELHVPVGQPVKLILTSEDVIHSFFVPAFRIKCDAVPGRYASIWFEATKTGTFDLFCAEYCGTNHSGMVGRIVVQSPQDHQQWLGNRAEGSLALEGRKRFLHYQCTACHTGDALARAPLLEDLYMQPVPLRDGSSKIADENYLRESILVPDAKVVAGYEPIMPSFQGQIPEDELIELIAYLKTARRGQTPPRIDEAQPPRVEAKPEPGNKKPASQDRPEQRR